MPTDLWRISLQTLRNQFEAGAQQYPGLRCVLIHAGPGELERIEDHPRHDPTGKFVDGGTCVYEEAATPNRCSCRAHYYIGEPAAVDLFQSLAQEAGRCCSAPQPLFRWLWQVFELAWQRMSGSPLTARKMIWDREYPSATFPYDIDLLRALPGFGPDFLEKCDDGLPDYFCSELSDAFLASLYTIDILLSDASPDAALAASVDLTYSESFDSVRWHGQPFDFRSPQQRKVVEKLIKARRDAFPWVTTDDLKKAAGSAANEFIISHVFRTSKGMKHPALGTMIISDKSGRYRIAD